MKRHSIDQALEKAALVTSLTEGEQRVEMVPFNVRVPKAEKAEFAALCAERDVTMSEAIRILMKLYKFVKPKAK